jgi:hypothetical protein
VHVLGESGVWGCGCGRHCKEGLGLTLSSGCSLNADGKLGSMLRCQLMRASRSARRDSRGTMITNGRRGRVGLRLSMFDAGVRAEEHGYTQMTKSSYACDERH